MSCRIHVCAQKDVTAILVLVQAEHIGRSVRMNYVEVLKDVLGVEDTDDGLAADDTAADLTLGQGGRTVAEY